MTTFQLSSDMFDALSEAVLAIAEGLSLPRTLQRIADTARALIKTKYAALGVLSDDGTRLKQFITSGIEPQLARRIHHEPSGMGLLGNIFREGKSIRVEDIAQDHRSVGFCENHPHMTTFIGVPITNRGQRIGNLYLCDKLDGQAFTEQDEAMLEFLAAHAAIAIENAHLHNELQAISLRNERDRIGMELHDGVIQSIYAIGMKIEIIQGRLELTPQQHGQFGQILGDLNHIIDDIRSYIRNLISAHEEHATLHSQLENVVTHFRAFSGVKVALEVAEDLPMLSDSQRHNVMQMLREALANVARHAEASNVAITIHHVMKDFVLKIKDDGQGFDLEAVESAATGHFGLHNIRQRVVRMGGSLEISTTRQQGTTLVLRFPIQPV